MIFSPSKMKDMELRDNYLEIAEVALRGNFLDQANYFIQESDALKETIRSYDYTKDDERAERFEKMLWANPIL